jgi:uncharacterized protein (DUF305 family)
MQTIRAVLFGAALLASLPAAGQQTHDMGAMPGMQHGTPDAAASTRGYQAAMEKMHAAMAVPYSGNADADFVAGMIPHHAGAIDMARVELQYGHDPALRRLAGEIIKAQDREIALMLRWQASHGAH